MKKAFKQSSLMTASLHVPDGEKHETYEIEKETETGLICGHSYSITNVCQAKGQDLGNYNF